MDVSVTTVQKIIISDVLNLDTIAVYLEDYGPRRGKITITCFNGCWSYFWGGMGNDYNIRKFYLSCDKHYLAGKLSPQTDSHVNDLSTLVDTARKYICKMRRDTNFSKETSRELFDESEKLDGISDFHDLESDLMFRIFGDEWWYSIPKQTNHTYEYLCLIIETVKSALQKVS